MKSGTQGLERETSAPALDEGIEESCSKFANFLFSLVSRIFANRCERCRQAGRDSVFAVLNISIRSHIRIFIGIVLQAREITLKLHLENFSDIKSAGAYF